MPWKPTEEDKIPTLGWYVIDWFAENLAAPAKLEYEPFVLYREQEDFILKWYALDPDTGRFLFDRGLLGRSRGWGKSPLLGALSCVEALGDVLFDGWDADGQPVGRPWNTRRTPLVQIAAVSEEQTGNTWQPMLEMLRGGPVIENYPGLEPYDSVVNLPGGFGEIKQITSSARTTKGAPVTFAVLDQALAVDTPIPTPTGWVPMGDLVVGDEVYGSTGTAVRVTAAKPWSIEHDCYRVHLADGTSVVASAGHLWQTRVHSSAAKPRVRTTEQMVTDGRRFRIPVAPPRVMPEADLPAHPYLLGVWLGDGTRGKCEITVSHDDVADLRGNLAAIGVDSWERVYDQGAVNLTFTQARGFGMVNRPEPAKAIQALPCYRDKHVPDAYLNGSIEQRTALLQGLMDSDGSVTAAGTCTFVNTSRRLTDAVVALLRSLGQVTSGAKWVADDRYTGGGKYRVDFTARGGMVPFRMPRKVARVRQHRRGPAWITVARIERVATVPVRCIAVDSDDHLFAYGEGGHLTHNTEEWVASNGGHSLAKNMRDNTAKNGGRTVESPNAFTPGEGSVAEKSAEYAQGVAEGRVRVLPFGKILWDHREADASTDKTDYDSLIEGLRYAYGDSSGHPDGCTIHDPPCPPGHQDLDAIVSRIWDPDYDALDADANYLNMITHAKDAWTTRVDWNAAGEEARAKGFEPPKKGDRAPQVLGFDGSQGRAKGKADATALVAVDVRTGLAWAERDWVWEQPEDWKPEFKGDVWAPDVTEVENMVDSIFADFNVVGFFADPSGWSSSVARWEAKYGKRLKVKATPKNPIAMWPRGKTTDAAAAVEFTRKAIETLELTHAGVAWLTRHCLNARRRAARQGYLLYKAYPSSPRKIDGAYALTMAWKCRLQAVSLGLGRPPRTEPPKKQKVLVLPR